MDTQDTWEGIDDPVERLKAQTNILVREIVIDKGYPLVSGIAIPAFSRAARDIGFPLNVQNDAMGFVLHKKFKTVESWTPKKELGTSSAEFAPWSVENFSASLMTLANEYYPHTHACSSYVEFQELLRRKRREFTEAFGKQIWTEIETYGESVLWCDGYRHNQDAFASAIERISLNTYIQSMEFGSAANGPVTPTEIFKIKAWYNIKQKTMPRARAIEGFVKGIFLSNLVTKNGYTLNYHGKESQEYACVELGTKILSPWLSSLPVDTNAKGHPRSSGSPKWYQY